MRLIISATTRDEMTPVVIQIQQGRKEMTRVVIQIQREKKEKLQEIQWEMQ